MMEKKNDPVNHPAHYCGKIEDLEKARWYLDKKIALLKEQAEELAWTE